MHAIKRIFLVEDDPDDQLFFANAVNEIAGASLFGVAKNGKEAIELLENSGILPSVIFMDIAMPVMNGLECLQYIITNSKLRLIPVVMLSSSTQYKKLSVGLGASEFIEKTFNQEKLRDSLDRVLQQEIGAYV